MKTERRRGKIEVQTEGGAGRRGETKIEKENEEE
jgi:hypothetical protein